MNQKAEAFLCDQLVIKEMTFSRSTNRDCWKLQSRSKSTSEPNCIQFDTVRGWKHCAFDWKIN
ncbi:Uncharacterized protein TSPI_00536 [Trichinella spiralis]|uniref:Uncharacterized protein n=1 Tax=Trichinella spiralis TaxID=6334 RepID=A0ABR3KP40_TRISP